MCAYRIWTYLSIILKKLHFKIKKLIKVEINKIKFYTSLVKYSYLKTFIYSSNLIELSHSSTDGVMNELFL